MLLGRLEARVGGRAWLIVVASLAAVLALDAADKGAIGASATELQAAFSIGPTGIGLLVTASSLLTAAATIPMGALVDRVRRTRLLSVVVVVWAVAMLAGAAAPTYPFLLASRVVLGAASAVAYPAVASLVGDWFPQEDRGRVMGLLLAGELVGTGVGVAVAGGLTAVVSWRVAFAVLGLAALGVAWQAHRLPEPGRAGASRLVPGQQSVTDRHPARDGEEPDDTAEERSPVRDMVAAADVDADTDAVPEGGAGELGLWAVLRYVLRIRTNVVLIVSSALGYYMFAGLRTFGLEFAQLHYGVGRGAAFAVIFLGGIGGVVGVVSGGRVSDRLLARGRLDARIVVPAVAFLAMTAAFVPAALTASILVATPFLVVAAFFLAFANPPLDAARLDVVPSAMWGRAEAVRMVLRTGLEALAPLAFGATAEHLFGGRTGEGLQGAILVMLVPLVASPLVLLLGRRSYPTDVATAMASESALAGDDGAREQVPVGDRRSARGDGGDRGDRSRDGEGHAQTRPPPGELPGG